MNLLFQRLTSVVEIHSNTNNTEHSMEMSSDLLPEVDIDLPCRCI